MKRNRLDDLSLILKIGFAPAFALVALLLVTGSSLVTQHRQSSALQEVVNKDMAVSLRLATISKRITAVHAELYVLLTLQATPSKPDPAVTQARIDALTKEADAIKADLAVVRRDLPPSQQHAFLKLNEDLTTYRDAIDVVGSMLGVDFATAAAFVAPFEANYRRMIQTLDHATNTIEAAAQAKAEARVADARLASLVTAIGSVLTLIAVVAVAGVAVLGVRRAIARIAGATETLARGDNNIDLAAMARQDELGSIVRSLSVFRDNQLRLEVLRREQDAMHAQSAMVVTLAEGLSRLSHGDLTCNLDQPFAAEYEPLRTDFNAAVARLGQTLRVIAAAAADIDLGADEIAKGSDDLSRRTEQQASSLEVTAGALGELTATVKQSALSARQASDLASATQADAVASGEVVRQAIAAMGRIEQSSQEIAQIARVINDIASKTNLLALNAGIEAARAGQAGSGFAVVAQEVRALAQRSASAAKEINGLVLASSNAVGAGVTHVGETGEALQRIIHKVGDMADLISEIAATATRQASGLGDVNGAVSQMDQVTQQNASMVEESAVAMHSLKHETAELARLIAAFKLGDLDAASPLRMAKTAS